MSAEQLLTQARAVMTDNEGPQNWLPPPPNEHLQNQKCAVAIENLPATGVVVPTTWQRTAYRIAKRDWTFGCTRFVERYAASDAVALDI